MNRNKTRREFLKETALISAAVAAYRTVEGQKEAAPSGNSLPTIQLGSLRVSRLILGSNPFFGFSHGNPQATGDAMRKYYTEERIMSVMDEAAEQGIQAVWTPAYDHWIRVWNRYRKNGGKLKIWIGQPDRFEAMKEHITRCAKNGGKAICIQGECAGRAIREGKLELVKEWLQLIKSHGLPAGLASHHPEYILKAEEKDLPAEFYHLTVGIPDSYREKDRKKALETIRRVDKPMVAFKVLGAGRFLPREAFPRVLAQLRPKDGMCVGVFPAKNPHQLHENAALTKRLSSRGAGADGAAGSEAELKTQR
jgi:hypothetical protein